MPHNAHRLQKIGIVGEDSRQIECSLESVADKMRPEIDVRALFFGLPDVSDFRGSLGRQCKGRSKSWRLHQTGPFMIDEEIPEMNGHIRQRRQCPQISMLMSRRVKTGSARDMSRIIIDA